MPSLFDQLDSEWETDNTQPTETPKDEATPAPSTGGSMFDQLDQEIEDENKGFFQTIKEQFIGGGAQIMQGIGQRELQHEKRGGMPMVWVSPEMGGAMPSKEQMMQFLDENTTSGKTEEELKARDEKFEKRSQEITDTYKPYMKEIPQSAGLPTKIAGTLANSALSMGATTVNPVAGFQSIFDQIYGSKFTQLKVEGKDTTTANDAAALAAITQAPIELIMDRVGLGLASKTVNRLAPKSTVAKALTAVTKLGDNTYNKLVKGNKLKEFFWNVIKGGSGEYLEEFTQAELDVFADTFADNPDASMSEIMGQSWDKLWSMEQFKSANEQGLMGLAGGMVMQTGAGGLGVAANAIINPETKLIRRLKHANPTLTTEEIKNRYKADPLLMIEEMKKYEQKVKEQGAAEEEQGNSDMTSKFFEEQTDTANIKTDPNISVQSTDTFNSGISTEDAVGANLEKDASIVQKVDTQTLNDNKDINDTNVKQQVAQEEQDLKRKELKARHDAMVAKEQEQQAKRKGQIQAFDEKTSTYEGLRTEVRNIIGDMESNDNPNKGSDGKRVGILKKAYIALGNRSVGSKTLDGISAELDYLRDTFDSPEMVLMTQKLQDTIDEVAVATKKQEEAGKLQPTSQKEQDEAQALKKDAESSAIVKTQKAKRTAQKKELFNDKAKRFNEKGTPPTTVKGKIGSGVINREQKSTSKVQPRIPIDETPTMPNAKETEIGKAIVKSKAKEKAREVKATKDTVSDIAKKMKDRAILEKEPSAQDTVDKKVPTKRIESSDGEYKYSVKDKVQRNKPNSKWHTKVNMLVHQAMKTLKNTTKVRVFRSIEDLKKYNKEAYDYIQEQGVADRVEAFFDKDAGDRGEIYMFSDQFINAFHAKQTMWHELGHYSLQDLLGDNITPVMNKVKAKYMKDKKVELTNNQAEEILLDRYVTGKDRTLKQTVKDILRKLAQKLGMSNKEITDADIDDLINAMHKSVVMNEQSIPKSIRSFVDTTIDADNIPVEDSNYKFSVAKRFKPEKTEKFYKLVRIKKNKKGQIFPLVADSNIATPVGQWLVADKLPKKQIKRKLYRPGYYATRRPYTQHMGGKINGEKFPTFRKDDEVWVEIEVPVDRKAYWQTEAIKNAKKDKKGNLKLHTAHVQDRVPKGGYYEYAPNAPDADGNFDETWILAGHIKVNKILTDQEVEGINAEAGVSDLPRKKNQKLTQYGFKKKDLKFSLAETTDSLTAEQKGVVMEAEKKYGLEFKGYEDYSAYNIPGLYYFNDKDGNTFSVRDVSDLPKTVKERNLKYMLAGINAQTADNAWIKAKDMINRGMSEEYVWKRTGWLKGVEGKWKFEIDDSGMKLKLPDSFEAGATNPNEYFLPDGRKATPFLIMREHLKDKTEQYKGVPLPELIDHPRLFKLYPDMKHIRVFHDPLASSLGYQNGDYIHINVHKNMWNQHPTVKNEIEGTLFHEIQHWIQEKEGFARGGSPESALYFLDKKQIGKYSNKALKIVDGMVKDRQALMDRHMDIHEALRLIPESMRDKANQVKSEIDETLQMLDDYQATFNGFANILAENLDDPDLQPMFEDLHRYTGLSEQDLVSIYATLEADKKIDTSLPFLDLAALARQKASKLKGEIANLNTKQRLIRGKDVDLRTKMQALDDTIFHNDIRYPVYRALAGEIESNSVSNRLKLTEAQRKELLPYIEETTLPQDEWIIRDSAWGTMSFEISHPLFADEAVDMHIDRYQKMADEQTDSIERIKPKKNLKLSLSPKEEGAMAAIGYNTEGRYQDGKEDLLNMSWQDHVAMQVFNKYHAIEKMEQLTGEDLGTMSGSRAYHLTSNIDSMMHSIMHYGDATFENEWFNIDVKKEGGLANVWTNLGKNADEFFKRLTAKSAIEFLEKNDSKIKEAKEKLPALRKELKAGLKKGKIGINEAKRRIAEIKKLNKQAIGRFKGKRSMFGDVTNPVTGEKMADYEVASEVLRATETLYNENKQVWDRSEERLKEINTAMIDFAVKANRISKETGAQWKERENYVAFFRQNLDDWNADPFSKGSPTGGNPFKQLQGSTRNVGDPFANIVSSYGAILNQSIRNLAKSKALKTALELGIANKVPKPTKHADILYVNGQKQYYNIKDQNLYEAMESLNDLTKGKYENAIRILSKPKKWLTFGVTLDPAFRVANFVRDTIQTSFMEPGYSPLKAIADASKGLKDALFESDEFKEFVATGGAFKGAYHERDILKNKADKIKTAKKRMAKQDKTVKELRTPLDLAKWLYKGYERFGEASENANRMRVYRNEKARGKSKMEAGFSAKDLLDFHRSGKSEALGLLLKTVPFLNARLQGLNKLSRTAFNKQTAVNFWVHAVGMGIAAAMLQAHNEDDERYQELPLSDKVSYWHTWVGDVHLKVPTPFEVGSLFGVYFPQVINNGLKKALGKDEDMNWKDMPQTDMAFLIANDVLRLDYPQFYKPIQQQAANKVSYTGAPIVGQWEEKLPPEYQYAENTSTTARAVGKAVDVTGIDNIPFLNKAASPKRIDQFVKDTFGWIGSTALATMDAGIFNHFYTPKATPKEGEGFAWKVSHMNRFIKSANETPRFTEYQRLFYDYLGDAEQFDLALSKTAKLGLDSEVEKIAETKIAEIELSKGLKKYQAGITKINAAMRQIAEDTALSPDEKREQIDEYTQLRNELFKEANDELIKRYKKEKK